MKEKVRSAILAGQQLMFPMERGTKLNVVGPAISDADKDEIRRRTEYFLPGCQELIFSAEVTTRMLVSPAPIAFFNTEEPVRKGILKGHSAVFNIDFRKNPIDGWAWIEAAAYAEQSTINTTESQQRLVSGISRIQERKLSKCYVFGTGPSLSLAAERDWSDGYRIVCNTIVRDPSLWAHIDPDIIVAGDGIYHFGFTAFARAFQKDLRNRLENSRALFLYPEQFDVIVRRDLGHLADRLVPVPIGSHVTMHTSFANTFALPALGNVLNLLLLPVGCNLSKHVGLWGFDGRAPVDQLFWANSVKQSYTELLPTLQAAHPAFFDHNVPKEDPEKYLRAVHGDVLEHALTEAESAGWTFEMLHPTWTETLRKRSSFGPPA